VILDQDHRVSHFNASAERIWGVARAEILGRPAGALGLNDLDEDRRTELTITRPDGDRLRVALSLSHVMSGGVHHTIARVRDITPDLELRERLALHVMIADGNNRAVIIVDRNMKVVYVNATFAGMFGHRIETSRRPADWRTARWTPHRSRGVETVAALRRERKRHGRGNPCLRL
jgi:PAS domain S-box-containing protein